MIIDCDECAGRDTAACDDCVVSFLLDRPDGPITFDGVEQRALHNLFEAGLAPANRFCRRPTASDATALARRQRR